MGLFARKRSAAAGPRITVIDRTGCHLCDQAVAVVDDVARRAGVDWERVDVDSSPELLHKYADLVPVVLVDGREIAHWTVTGKALTSALARGRSWRARYNI
ncbi:glutaredoxin family protein [Ornithinimicrobium ciconiae]|uniref:Glutaredoxin family protein n=1 Tax=Ornithinimicrobium ciconiae TaxID=2594265 RepID=A0A516GEC4_9MICO|nr:glutaredoxin family protein [Ornithinimicrobium ciconiae]QDO89861.1 glutaredoxin family protein [Ornithinimicrobium ciconiae]